MRRPKRQQKERGTDRARNECGRIAVGKHKRPPQIFFPERAAHEGEQQRRRLAAPLDEQVADKPNSTSSSTSNTLLFIV